VEFSQEVLEFPFYSLKVKLVSISFSGPKIIREKHTRIVESLHFSDSHRLSREKSKLAHPVQN
jgi:hypothetical protein